MKKYAIAQFINGKGDVHDKFIEGLPKDEEKEKAVDHFRKLLEASDVSVYATFEYQLLTSEGMFTIVDEEELILAGRPIVKVKDGEEIPVGTSLN
jgi:hypothetical protein